MDKVKVYTIQDLAEGKVAAVYSGDLEELRLVMKAAFPESSYYPSYPELGRVYYKHPWHDWTWCLKKSIKLPTQSVREFIKQLKTKGMSKEFPIEIDIEQAQSIIDIACQSWKKDLVSEWSYDMLVHKTIKVSQEFYIKMRNACTEEQHKLFDNIFGKDEVQCPYEEGELCWVKGYREWNLRYATGGVDNSGKPLFFTNQRKSGDASTWVYHKSAKGIKLPD